MVEAEKALPLWHRGLVGEGYYATTLLLHLSCCETGEQLPGRLPQALLSTEAQLSHTEVGQK